MRVLVENKARPNLDNSTRRKHLAWVKAIMHETGWSQTELARRAGRDPSTLSRFIRGVNPGAKLDAETVEAIDRLGVIPSFDTVPPAKPRGFEEGEAESYTSDRADEAVSRAISAIKDGRNGLDAWVLRSRALINAGYFPGDILMVDQNAEPADGDTVCAQVYDKAGKAETVFRIYEEPYLVSATHDPELRRPLYVGKDHVAVMGVVVATVKPRRAA